MITAVVTALLTALLLLVPAFLLYRRMARAVREVQEAVAGFFNPPKEGEASQFAVLTDRIALQFAARIAGQVKATVLGMQSAASREVDRLEAAAAEDMVGQANPLAGAALQMFPGAAKKLARSQVLGPLLSYFLNRQPAGNNHKEVPAQADFGPDLS